MFKFIFRMTDGSRYELKDIEPGFEYVIWKKIDEYCMMFESESNKVKTVMQVKM